MNQQILYRFTEDGNQEEIICNLPLYCRYLSSKGFGYVKKLTRGFVTKISIREPQATVSMYPNTTYPLEELITEEEFNKEIEMTVSLIERVLKRVKNN